MSAFIVHNDHINAILNYVLDHARIAGDQMRDPEHLTQLGNILLAANFASVNYRYKQVDTPDTFKFARKHIDTLGAVDILKMLQCLKYQSCERHNWDKSNARKLIDQLISIVIYTLPGYSDAQWAFTYVMHSEKLAAKRAQIRASITR